MLVLDVIREVERQTDDASTTTRLSVRTWLDEILSDFQTRLQDTGIFEEERSLRILPELIGTANSPSDASVVTGSRLATFAAGTWTIDRVGSAIRFGSENEVYTLERILASHQALLDRPYEGPTSAVVGWVSRQDRLYPGGDVERMFSPARATNPIRIASWTGSEKDAFAPNPHLQGQVGQPYLANVIGRRTIVLFDSSEIAVPVFVNVTDGSAVVSVRNAGGAPVTALTIDSLYGVLGAGALSEASERLWSSGFKLDREARIYRVARIRVNAAATGDEILLDEPYQLPQGETATSGLSFQISHFETPVLSLWPVPNQADTLRLRYQRALPRPIDDLDSLPYPSRVHTCLLSGVLWKAFDYIGRIERAAFHKSEYEQKLESIRRTIEGDQIRSWTFRPWGQVFSPLSQPLFPPNFDNRRGWIF